MSENQQEARKRASWINRLRAPQVAPPWSVTDVIYTLVALLVFMFLVAPSVASLTSAEFLTPRALLFGWMIGLLLTTGFVLLNRQRTQASREALRIVGNTRPSLFFVLLYGIAAALVVDLIVGLPAGGFSASAVLSQVSRDPGTEGGTWLLAALLVVLVQPIAESLVFYGVTLPRLRASIGPVGGYAITIGLFTSYHFAAFGSTLLPATQVSYGLIVPLLIGAFLGAVRTRTSSTLAVIVAYIGIGGAHLLTALALSG
jgi:membrane protease YdiL (CAAX protease family)